MCQYCIVQYTGMVYNVLYVCHLFVRFAQKIKSSETLQLGEVNTEAQSRIMHGGHFHNQIIIMATKNMSGVCFSGSPP